MAATIGETKAEREVRLSTMQRERLARAVTEEFEFVQTHERLTCYSPKSGNVYIVSEQGCTCPDFQRRCGPQGIRCKHQVNAINRGLLG